MKKLMQVAEGLPELFYSSKVSFNNQAGNYSFARYSDDELIYQQRRPSPISFPSQLSGQTGERWNMCW
jgi:hypothetical protein